MNQNNPFAEDAYVPSPPKPNSTAIVLIALASVGGVMLLMCGGIIAGSVYLSQRMPNPAMAINADMDEYYQLRAGQSSLDVLRKEICCNHLISTSLQLPAIDTITGRQIQNLAICQKFSKSVADILMDVPASGKSF